MMRTFLVSAAFAMLVLAGSAGAEQTWHVDDDAPADFTTIQAALDASSDNDTIIVRDGTYSGPGNRNIDFGGRAIHLRSENGPSKCIIDAEDQARVFYFHGGGTEDTVLEGFTIRNGKVNGDGGGILCSASPTIRNNVIVDNQAVNGNGGGICVDGGMPLILNNTIFCNIAHGAFVSTISRQLSLGGWGGGICVRYGGAPIVSNCVIYGNSTTYQALVQIYPEGFPIAYSLVTLLTRDQLGEGNITDPPLFADPRGQDYHLKSRYGRFDGADWIYDNETSPGIDAGAPQSDASAETRPGACRINMGAYGNTSEASRGIDREALGDANGDCRINILDMIEVRNYLKADPTVEGNGHADINKDGDINVLDMLSVRNNIGLFSL